MTVVEQKTLQDNRDFVREFQRKEGVQPNDSLNEGLLWECLARVFRITRAYDTSWDNSSGGRLTLSGNEVALPYDCLEVTRVEWDGSENKLDILTEQQADYLYPGWRDDTGEPGFCVLTRRRLFLATTPTEPTTGKLVVRGCGVPPEEDALSYFPVDLQLAPARYVLANLPFDPEKPAEVARYQRFSAEWARAEPRIIDALGGRSARPFEYP